MRELQRVYIAGLIAGLPWLVAAVGWAAGWNAYFNLTLTLGGAVVIAVGLLSVSGRGTA